MKSNGLNLVLTLVTVLLMVGYGQPVMGCGQHFPAETSPSDTVRRASLGTPVQLGHQQGALIEAETLRIEFLEITADSRCPSDVVCIQAGQVTARLRLSLASEESAVQDVISLTLGAAAGDQAMAKFDGYTIELIEVDPEPVSTEAIAPSQYVVTIVVSEA